MIKLSSTTKFLPSLIPGGVSDRHTAIVSTAIVLPPTRMVGMILSPRLRKGGIRFPRIFLIFGRSLIEYRCGSLLKAATRCYHDGSKDNWHHRKGRAMTQIVAFGDWHGNTV